jgi:uncharacterized protein YjlB
MVNPTPAPQALMFADDGWVPNNPTLPVLVYHEGIDIKGSADPERVIERAFTTNGWGHNMWRNGIATYVHYHSMIHEAMAIARGRVKLRVGGDMGKEVSLSAGDVVVLPAGTAHQELSASPDLKVVGAYPPDGTFNFCRGAKFEHEAALKTIPLVPLPKTDPVRGAAGPLLQLWPR